MRVALAGWLCWLEPCPVNQNNVVGSDPGRGAYRRPPCAGSSTKHALGPVSPVWVRTLPRADVNGRAI